METVIYDNDITSVLNYKETEINVVYNNRVLEIAVANLAAVLDVPFDCVSRRIDADKIHNINGLHYVPISEAIRFLNEWCSSLNRECDDEFRHWILCDLPKLANPEREAKPEPEVKLKTGFPMVFTFESSNVRTMKDEEGNPWFVGKDVAEVLGYVNTKDALAKHVDDEDRMGSQIATPSRGMQTVTIINESGLYSLVLSSKLPSAKRFKKWITSEVIPTIRKHGAYMTDEKIEEVLSDPDTIIKLANQLKRERERRKLLENEKEENRPKVLFADSVCASRTSILIGELAKIMKQNGFDVGQNRLFETLRNDGFLMKDGTSKNLPTQRAMELGLFEIKETSISHSDGHITISKTPKVTGKGQVYFINRYITKSQPILNATSTANE